MKRVYHPYDKWEEYKNGMWRIVSETERRDFAEKAAALMREVDCFRDAMMRAVAEWPVSCEQNLTAAGVNKRAWLGHAGCCIATNAPEDATRLGWHMLTEEEQDAANAAADDAHLAWQKGYHAKA